MQVTPGSRLGPYEVLSRIGAGGMGEVFKARDTRLDRNVAIKILPEEFAADAHLRQRFEREAKTISQLNHPHICMLHDVGENYLVMELLEGQTVADRLAAGPLPMRDVIRYGAQIADALDRAHRAGIVHRDLKPANVMLTRSGAKLLDFGLAKPKDGVIDLDGATQLKPLTQEGTIVGTFQYMAPEQLEGGPADARTDIFALGALLYEMATGRRAFEGKTKTSLIAAIVGSEPPPMSALQPVTPAAFEHVVSRCLAKDPDDRWQSAHDLAGELRWIAEAGSHSAAAMPAAAAHRRGPRVLVISLVAFGLLAAAVIGAMMLLRALNAALRPVTTDLVAPDGMSYAAAQVGPMALSPAGDKLAFIANTADGAYRLWIRDLGTGTTRMLNASDQVAFPFWSPDGTSLGYFAGEKLMVVHAATGATRQVCEAPRGRGASWGERGVIVFAPNLRGPLFRVAASGGQPEPLTSTSGPNVTHRNPLFLPGGTHFLYIERAPSMDTGTLMAGSIDDPKFRKVIRAAASNAAYAAGTLFYRAGDSLVAQRFDADELSLEGQPVTVADGVDYYNPRDLAAFTASNDGRLAYRVARPVRSQVVMLDAGGRETAKIGDPAAFDYMYATVSRDGRFLISARREAIGTRGDLWVTDLQRGTSSRLTFLSSTAELTGAMAPDGSRIAVSEFGARTSKVVVYEGNRQHVLATDAVPLGAIEWTPDGRFLAAIRQTTETGWDVVAIDASSGKIAPVAATRFAEGAPSLSPDGKWLLYGSDESGRFEAYVTSFPHGGRTWPVSAMVSTEYRWNARGDAILLMSGGKMYSVAVRATAGGLELDAPQPMTLDLSGYADPLPLPDGRWVAFKLLPEQQPEPIRLIVNWPRLIRR